MRIARSVTTSAQRAALRRRIRTGRYRVRADRVAEAMLTSVGSQK